MKHIQIPNTFNLYPVGSDLHSVRIYLNYLREAFLGLYPDKRYNLWCRGSSGAILAAMFTMLNPEYEFFICHVKKKGEESHSSPLSAYNKDGVNIVIDDFINSGETIAAILEVMYKNDIQPQILMANHGAKGSQHYLTTEGIIRYSSKEGEANFEGAFEYIISND